MSDLGRHPVVVSPHGKNCKVIPAYMDLKNFPSFSDPVATTLESPPVSASGKRLYAGQEFNFCSFITLIKQNSNCFVQYKFLTPVLHKTYVMRRLFASSESNQITNLLPIFLSQGQNHLVTQARTWQNFQNTC